MGRTDKYAGWPTEIFEEITEAREQAAFERAQDRLDRLTMNLPIDLGDQTDDWR